MEKTPFIHSTWSFIFASCLFMLSLIKCAYGRMHYKAYETSMALPIFIGYCVCIAIAIRCIWLTPSRREQLVCGATALSFLFIMVSRYSVGSRQHAFTIASAICWIVAAALVFMLYGQVHKDSKGLM